MRRVMFWALFCLMALWPGLAGAQRPPAAGRISSKAASALILWTSYSSGSFNCGATAKACPAGYTLSALTVYNAGTRGAWVLFARRTIADAVPGLGAIYVPAGAAWSDIDTRADAPEWVSVAGDGGGTDLYLTAWWVTR